MLKNLVNKAKSIAENTINKSKQTASDSLSSAKSEFDKKAEEYWPKIETFIIEKALPLAEEELENEESLGALFEKAYEMLPIVIRIALSRDKFIAFCMLKKEPLLKKIKEYRSEKEDSQNNELLLKNGVRQL